MPLETACKLGFRYFVPNGGPTGTNSDQVGIDQFTIERQVLSTTDFFTTNFSIHPNPVTDVLYITSKNSAIIEMIEVVDVNGRLLKHTSVSNSNSTQINLSNLNSGVYFVKVQSELGVGTSKIIKN
jgi:hypothetical protein